MGKHECGDSRCNHNPGAVFKKVKKNGLAIVTVFDEPMKGALTAYTVGLYANYNIPELLMKFEVGIEYDRATGVVILAAKALLNAIGAEMFVVPKKPQLHPRQARPLAIKYGHAVEISEELKLYVWPEDGDAVQPFRQIMTTTAAYYRELFMTPFEHVPVALLSGRPFELCGEHQDAFDRHDHAAMN